MPPRIITPSMDRHRTGLDTEGKLYKGLDAWTHGAVGRVRRSRLNARRLMDEIRAVEAREDAFAGLSDRALKARLAELREPFSYRRDPDLDIRNEALAAVREAARRALGLYAYPVQLAAVVAMSRGGLAEMATGEGKTLSAALAAVLAGWRGRPCHVVTANDYLAQRDARWMRPFYEFCGLHADYVIDQQKPPERKQAYAADIVYLTSKEAIADFLRDRSLLGDLQHFGRRQVRALQRGDVLRDAPLVQRGLHTAIVDEADNLLIDEAVTPVILSGQHANPAFEEACREAAHLAGEMVCDTHYQLDTAYREVEWLPEGRRRMSEIAAGMPGYWRSPGRSLELVNTALNARHFYERDKHYVVEEEKVVIVDEFTGRLMPSRTWREGLHQAVESKEGLELSPPSETVMRLSVQRFFRFYTQLSGMTGTASEAAAEFWQIYGLPVVHIPTHRPVRREQLRPCFFADKAAKWNAVIAEIERVHGEGRPILVGIRAVKDSEMICDRLRAKGLDAQVLNAVRHREEAEIIAQAGQPGRITIATNMAGRGTDILLAGGVAERGGLFVLCSEIYESGRIDRQFYGRCARQGDPGTAVSFASLEDDLAVKMMPAPVRARLRRLLPGGHRAVEFAFRQAQRRAESRSFRSRKQVLKQDDWLEESMAFAGGSTAF